MNRNLKQILISFLLGCIAYYVFLCFTGVVLAFMLNSGFDSFIMNLFSDCNMRRIIFPIYLKLTPIIVCLVVMLLTTYFFSKPLSKRIITNSIILTIGSICTDLYYFIKLPFGSYFFISSYQISFFNIFIWCLSTIAVISLGSFLNSKTAQHGASRAEINPKLWDKDE